MCHKQYKEDGPVIRLTTGDVGWDLCAICFELVKKYINIQGNPQLKRILEYNERKEQCHECRHNKGGVCTTPYTAKWDDKFRCNRFEKAEPRKTGKKERPTLNRITDAKSGDCFHGEVWVRCPSCGEGHEMMGATPEWTEDKFRVYKCSKCGELFKDRITY